MNSQSENTEKDPAVKLGWREQLRLYFASFVQGVDDPQTKRRLYLLFLISGTGVITLIPFAFLAGFQGNNSLMLMDLAAAVCLLFNTFLARQTKRFDRAIFAGTVVAGCLFIYLLFDGGVNKTAFVWYYVYPPLAFFLMGVRKGAIASLLMLIPVAVLFAMDSPPQYLANYPRDLKIRFVPSYMVILIFSFVFEYTRELAQRQLLARNEELRAAQQEAEKANQAKSRFLANMSHEIRTPLNAIVGHVELTLDGEVSEQQRRDLEVIKLSSGHLLAVINDILDISKIEAGKVELESTPFNLHNCLSQTLTELAPNAEEKDLVLRKEVAKDIPETVYGDQVRLKQVLFNLLSNAIKFTPKGTVSLRVTDDSSEPNRHRITFEVSDTGIGISPIKRKVIFDAFSQADLSITREYGGTGLGLAITKNLVGLMGGKLWLESEPDHGSTFGFTLRMHSMTDSRAKAKPSLAEEVAVAEPPARPRKEPVAAEEEPGPEPLGPDGLRILLADDVAMNQTVAKRLLAKRGHQVTVAANGREAIDLWSRRDFDLILMDVQMPEIDGLEATRMIRREEDHSGAHIPIVAMTAHAMSGDKELCLLAGMDGYITKPFQPEDLYEAVETWGRKA